MSNEENESEIHSVPLVKKIFRLIKNSAGKSEQTKEEFIEELEQFYPNTLEDSQKEMISGIIALTEKNAREIMIPRVDMLAVDVNISLENLVKIISDEGHSRIPVYEENIDHIIGTLYVKELLKILEHKPKKFNLRSFLHNPFFIPETMPLIELLREFKIKRQHLAIVVDEYGGVYGIVTMEDILEEIVGDIQDEFDSEEIPDIQTNGHMSYLIDSRMSLIDINENLSLNLPFEEFDTIGGFVFDLFGKIPKVNNSISYENLTFKIKEIHGTKIIRLLLKIREQEEPEVGNS